ncbi:MAG: hypothetical protein ACE1ZA_08765, partial [Pseudomonadales bacterium]
DVGVYMSIVRSNPSGDAHKTSFDREYLSGLLFWISSGFSEHEKSKKVIARKGIGFFRLE